MARRTVLWALPTTRSGAITPNVQVSAMFKSSESGQYFVSESFVRDLVDPKPARRRGPRQTNYRSRSTPATLAKQARIRELLESTPGGLSVAELGQALGISRQLALYHVKKMAAAYGLTMVLEPCLENGGLQYRCWDDMQLAVHCAHKLRSAA